MAAPGGLHCAAGGVDSHAKRGPFTTRNPRHAAPLRAGPPGRRSGPAADNAAMRSRRVRTGTVAVLALALLGVSDGALARGDRKAARVEVKPVAKPYRDRVELARFITEVAERRALDPQWLREQLADARQAPRVAELIMPAAAGTAKNWAAYRERFIEPRRIAAGVGFWQAHADTLQRAETEFGVPAEIVVGILGVETFFGRMMGGFRVVDALATLSFDFPRGRSDRSDFFRSELEELLMLAHREGIRADGIRGSFAGAIGWPQFMPGSINRYALDYDGDGHIDLRESIADSIGSVAHFLQQHGWQRGQPTHFEVEPPTERLELATLLAPDIEPRFSAAQMQALGARLEPAAQGFAGALALVQVENGDAPPSLVAGTQNFYVVTRYNRSSYYALAVITLGEAVRNALGAASGIEAAAAAMSR